MRDRDVNHIELLGVLDAMPTRFRTKDVSNHPRMLAAHAAYRGDFNYHAMIGKALARLAGIGTQPMLRLNPCSVCVVGPGTGAANSGSDCSISARSTLAILISSRGCADTRAGIARQC
jgi:hypothetical protein